VKLDRGMPSIKSHVSYGEWRSDKRIWCREGVEARRGDPVSPFLFLLATEGFNVMMSKAMQLNLFEGYQIGGKRIKDSHLQYAEDTLIAGKKS